MKLRNKKTGGLANILGEQDFFRVYTDAGWADYDSLAELNEDWEDYKPAEPLIKDEKIRRGIRAWWDMQDNPFKTARVLLISEDKDLDGFYHWTIFGYIRNGEEKMSTKLEFRTKKLYSYEPRHDYTKEELCGEWEDYKPKEPLIKDEKIRKAVRAWAEMNDIRFIHMCSRTRKENARIVGQNALGRTFTMEIDNEYEIRVCFKDYKECYNIAELCGEDEE